MPTCGPSRMRVGLMARMNTAENGNAPARGGQQAACSAKVRLQMGKGLRDDTAEAEKKKFDHIHGVAARIQPVTTLDHRSRLGCNKQVSLRSSAFQRRSLNVGTSSRFNKTPGLTVEPQARRLTLQAKSSRVAPICC